MQISLPAASLLSLLFSRVPQVFGLRMTDSPNNIGSNRRQGVGRRGYFALLVTLLIVSVIGWKLTHRGSYVFPRSAYDNSVFIVPPGSVLVSEDLSEPESGRYIDTGSASSPAYLTRAYRLSKDWLKDDLLRWLLDHNPPAGWTFFNPYAPNTSITNSAGEYTGGFDIGRSSLQNDRWETVSIVATGRRSQKPDRIADQIAFVYYLGPCKPLKPCRPLPSMVWDQSDPGPLGRGWPPIPSTVFK
jgi:hypothetical protein